MSEAIVSFEDWTNWVLEPPYQAPALVGEQALSALASAERQTAIYLRRVHNSREITVINGPIRAIEEQVRRRHLLNQNSGPTARYGFVLGGPTRTGKTTVLQTFGKLFEQDLRTRHPERFINEGLERYTPVVYYSLPQAAGEKTISKGLADYLNVKYMPKENEHDITVKVLKELQRIRTEFLLIDEIQNLGRHGDSPAGRRAGQRANDYMKNLCNKTSATPFFAGTKVEESGLFNEFHGSRVTQTSGRFTLLKTRPYGVANDAELKQWRELILALEKPLHLYKHQRGDLVKMAHYLHDRTGGYVSTLSQLIREAAVLAIDSSNERIDRALLDTVEVDYLSTEAYSDLQRQAADATAKRAESARQSTRRAG